LTTNVRVVKEVESEQNLAKLVTLLEPQTIKERREYASPVKEPKSINLRKLSKEHNHSIVKNVEELATEKE